MELNNLQNNLNHLHKLSMNEKWLEASRSMNHQLPNIPQSYEVPTAPLPPKKAKGKSYFNEIGAVQETNQNQGFFQQNIPNIQQNIANLAHMGNIGGYHGELWGGHLPWHNHHNGAMTSPPQQPCGPPPLEVLKEHDNTMEPNITLTTMNNPEVPTSKPSTSGKKKRQRIKDGKRKMNKQLRQSGLTYTRSNGEIVKAREFKMLKCKCHYKCEEKLKEEDRKLIFTMFWGLASWDTQTKFISRTVQETACKRHIKTAAKHKSVTRHYYLNNVQVCRAVYCCTLGINHMRVTYCLTKKFDGDNIDCTDQRGQNTRRTSEEALEDIKLFLENIPKFHSHYSFLTRKVYFSQDMTKKKLHTMYIDQMKKDNKYYVSYPVFRKTLQDYNVEIFSPPKKESSTPKRDKVLEKFQ